MQCPRLAFALQCVLVGTTAWWAGCQTPPRENANPGEWPHVTAVDHDGHALSPGEAEAKIVADLRQRYGPRAGVDELWAIDLDVGVWKGSGPPPNGRWEIASHRANGIAWTEVRWYERDRPDRYFSRTLSVEEAQAWRDLVTTLRVDHRPAPAARLSDPYEQGRTTYYHLSRNAGRLVELDPEAKWNTDPATWNPKDNARHAHAELMLLLHQLGSHDLLQARYLHLPAAGLEIAYGTPGTHLTQVWGNLSGNVFVKARRTGLGDAPTGWCELRNGTLAGDAPEPAIDLVDTPPRWGDATIQIGDENGQGRTRLVAEGQSPVTLYHTALDHMVLAKDHLVGASGGKLVIVNLKTRQEVPLRNPWLAWLYVPVRYYASPGRVLLVHHGTNPRGEIIRTHFMWLNAATGDTEEADIFVGPTLPAQPNFVQEGYAWLPEIHPPQFPEDRHGHTTIQKVRLSDWTPSGDLVTLPFVADALWVDESNDTIWAVWDGVLWKKKAPAGWGKGE